MFPLDISYLRPNLGDDNRLYYRYLRYIGKVKAIEPANLILYHPMNEPSGGVAVDASPEGNDGAYTGVTLGQTGIGDGETCPLFDSSTSFNNIYSAGFIADFNGAEGTIAAWFKVSGVGVWIDAALRYGPHIYASGNNRVWIGRSTVNNTLQYLYRAGSVGNIVNDAGHSETGWFHAAMTWSAVADEMKAYFNGLQVGVTQTGLGLWAGNPSSDKTNVGCADNNTGPTGVWDGWLAHPPVWTKALTPAQILSLAAV